jgi:hypothetical protein
METSLHAALGVLLVATLASCRTPEPMGPARVTLQDRDGRPVTVRVEVVSRPADLARGLMHRDHLAPDAGMLFVYPDEDVRSFWMKNTLIPLDMLFIGANLRVVGVVENATPLSLEPRTVDAPARFVLEVNGGTVRRHGIKLGSLVRLEAVPGLGPAP